jgi:hypothetical protein
VLNDCPANLKNKQCFLRFVRNSNDLKTKNATIDDGGFAEFNEKIEMKTTIENDPVTNKGKPKLANLQAVLIEGAQEKMIGSCELDLADFVKPDKYLKQMTLQNISMGISQKSFITVEIRTSDGSKDSPTKSKIDPRQSVMVKATTQKNNQLDIYEK